MAFETWRGVHPASVLVNLVPRLWGLVRNLWPLLLAVLYGGISQEGFVDATLLLLFFVSGLTSSVVHAATLRYRVIDGRLEIRSGLFDRQARVVPIERIQNVSMVRNVFQRLSGLVEVQVETASGREAEGLLSAITVSRANELIAALAPSRRVDAGTPEAEVELVRNGVLDLVWAGASDLRLSAGIVFIGLLFEASTQFSAQAEVVTRVLSGWIGVLTAIAVVSGGWLVGILNAVVRGYGFRLVQTSRALVSERGLLTRRRAEVVRSKVQLLTWTEPFLLRLNGLGSLAIETAAAREAGSGTERAEVVVPIVDADEVRVVTAAALAEDGIDPARIELHPAHRRALRRALLGITSRYVLFVAVGVLLFGPWAAAAAIALPIAWWATGMDVVGQGYRLTDRLVIARHGYFTRRTAVLLRDKVQSVDVHQSPTLRWLGLARTTVRVAGSRVQLPLISLTDALAVQAALLGSARSG